MEKQVILTFSCIDDVGLSIEKAAENCGVSKSVFIRSAVSFFMDTTPEGEWREKVLTIELENKLDRI